MSRIIATFFGAGFLKPASGTWASAIAVALGVLAYQAGFALLVPVAAVLATIAGFLAVPSYLQATRGEDPSEVVIDEVAGQSIALSFTLLPLWWHGVPDLLTGAWPAWVVPFLLFRLFDIWKPWVIGRADRRGDPAGVMLDDLWAGLFAGVLSVALAGVYHGAMAWLG